MSSILPEGSDSKTNPPVEATCRFVWASDRTSATYRCNRTSGHDLARGHQSAEGIIWQDREADRPLADPYDTPVGYIIVERHVYGSRTGRLDADWDGEIHETREAAEAELALANAPDSDDPTQTPSDHWKVYELRPVGDA